MAYYAHVSSDGLRRQTVAEHLSGTAALCREFAAAFGAEADGELAGLAHDLGKCTDGFQKRLLENGPKVDHATAGAVACAAKGQLYASACVAGHHGGLQDMGNPRTDHPGDPTCYGRLKKGIRDQYLERCGESGISLSQAILSSAPDGSRLQASFWTRMLYSCLVDADFLDTAAFMNTDRTHGGYDSMDTLLERLKNYITPWQTPKTELNRLRCEILRTCMEAGEKSKGIYTLTVPTGGGKTVPSPHTAKHHFVFLFRCIPRLNGGLCPAGNRTCFLLPTRKISGAHFRSDSRQCAAPPDAVSHGRRSGAKLPHCQKYDFWQSL